MLNSVTNSNRLTMGGLATGLDTQALIEQLTYATRSKIAGKKQSIQTLQWKTDAYREVTSSLNSFKENFFSYSSKNNLLSSSLYTNGKISCSSPYVTVSGSASSAKNLLIKDIQQLAGKAALTTTSSLTESAIRSGTLSLKKEVHNLAGESFTLSYSGKNYTVTFGSDFTSTDPAEIASFINDSLAKNAALVDDSGNLKISAGLVEGATPGTQAFCMVNHTGDGNNVKIAAGTKSALSALGFSVSAGSATQITGSEINPGQFTATLNLAQTMKDNFLKLKLDGTEKTLTFEDAPASFGSLTEVSDYLNQKLNSAFAPGKVSASISGSELVLHTASQSSTLSVTGGGENLLGDKGVLGFAAGDSNRANLNSSLSDLALTRPLVGSEYTLSVNGKEFSFDAATSLNTILTTINSSDAGVKISFSSTLNKFTVEATAAGADGKIELNDSTGNLSEALFGRDYTLTAGTDAIVVVSLDGGLSEMTVERSSNAFTLDGVSITLNSKAPGDVAEEIAITVESNADELVSAFKAFVEEYNSIIDKLNGHLKTKPDRDYAPLTEEQKEEMSENEIKLWETKAKEGLLYNDNDLHNLATEMKSALTSFVGDVGLLSQYGIKFDAYLTGGKLTLNEEVFTQAVSENPDKLIACLTQKSTVNKAEDPKGYYASSGVFQRMSELIDTYASGYQDKGILVKKAGIANTSTASNHYLARQIQEYNDQITKLQRRLSMEETRYLKQFTALETSISNLNSQSSLFTNQ